MLSNDGPQASWTATIELTTGACCGAAVAVRSKTELAAVTAPLHSRMHLSA